MNNPYYFEDGQGKEPDLVGFLLRAAETAHREAAASELLYPERHWLHPEAGHAIRFILAAAAEIVYNRGSFAQPVAYHIQLAETILDRQAPWGSPNRDTPYVPRSQR